MGYLQELLGEAYKEGMSEEELGAALQTAGVGVVDPELTGKYSKLKDAFNKSSSETAKYKKLYNEKLSDEERTKNEQAEAMRLLQEENETLKKAQIIADYTAHFLSLGFTQDNASATAKAMADGDMDTVFKNTAAANAAREKQILAEALKKTPVPPAGDGNNIMTKEKFASLGWSEQMEWIKGHPNWKAELK